MPILWVWRVRARFVSLWPAAHAAIGTSLFWTSWARCSTCVGVIGSVLTIPILETALLGEYERNTGFRRLVRRHNPMTSRRYKKVLSCRLSIVTWPQEMFWLVKERNVRWQILEWQGMCIRKTSTTKRVAWVQLSTPFNFKYVGFYYKIAWDL